jgi:hypothetical protein
MTLYTFQVGGFIFSGHFTWIPLGENELQRRESDIAPARFYFYSLIFTRN